jgi:hypothetical protein
MSQRTTTRTPATRVAGTPLPSYQNFMEEITATNVSCGALIAVKGPAAKMITPAIRTQARNWARFVSYWTAHRAGYNAMLEAAAGSATAGGPTTATKSRRAGA